MALNKQSSLFGPAVLKLSFMIKDIIDQPGFRVIYFGTLKELGLVDSQIDAYIQEHRDELEAHIRDHNTKD